MSHQDAASAKQRRNLADEELTREVIASFERCESERLKEVMQALVRHLHAFLREVKLTEEEWFEAIQFLTRTGQISSENRQEFILLSDTLGASMQVIGINNRKPEGATEATVFGPFYVENSPLYDNGDDISNGAPGEPCFVAGHVRSMNGEPIANALLEVWQADDEGLYDVQREGLGEAQGRGQLHTDEDGRFHFRTVKPEPYPIPYDGPVGDMLKATNRSPMRPAHIHFRIRASGYETLTTHVFAAGDRYIDSDAVFGVKDSLVKNVESHKPGVAPDGTAMEVPFHTLRYDFVLVPSEG